MGDCRTCKFNSYIELSADVSQECFCCNHPTTLAKEARPERADPKMVDWRTADVRMSEIHMFKDCPAWQQHTPHVREAISEPGASAPDQSRS
jgi:hypothetical protein